MVDDRQSGSLRRPRSRDELSNMLTPQNNPAEPPRTSGIPRPSLKTAATEAARPTISTASNAPGKSKKTGPPPSSLALPPTKAPVKPVQVRRDAPTHQQPQQRAPQLQGGPFTPAPLERNPIPRNQLGTPSHGPQQIQNTTQAPSVNKTADPATTLQPAKPFASGANRPPIPPIAQPRPRSLASSTLSLRDAPVRRTSAVPSVVPIAQRQASLRDLLGTLPSTANPTNKQKVRDSLVENLKAGYDRVYKVWQQTEKSDQPHKGHDASAESLMRPPPSMGGVLGDDIRTFSSQKSAAFGQLPQLNTSTGKDGGGSTSHRPSSVHQPATKTASAPSHNTPGTTTFETSRRPEDSSADDEDEDIQDQTSTAATPTSATSGRQGPPPEIDSLDDLSRKVFVLNRTSNRPDQFASPPQEVKTNMISVIKNVCQNKKMKGHSLDFVEAEMESDYQCGRNAALRSRVYWSRDHPSFRVCKSCATNQRVCFRSYQNGHEKCWLVLPLPEKLLAQHAADGGDRATGVKKYVAQDKPRKGEIKGIWRDEESKASDKY
ncbi:hypothetical protein PRZ48_000250 [Zasmidium cellare]|uniref:Uncharacterized protein n=1 Tax=Zasmidium cellare TaxID=395010 RepID=A0ABR0EZJ5_ZASCE|nr:hypothetical protein PRZ48_000250 [Zasmidium cellare]